MCSGVRGLSQFAVWSSEISSVTPLTVSGCEEVGGSGFTLCQAHLHLEGKRLDGESHDPRLVRTGAPPFPCGVLLGVALC